MTKSKNWIWLKGLNFFSIWLKELNFLFDSKKWTSFFELWLTELHLFNLTHRKCYSKNWIFFDCDSQELSPLFLIWLKELNPLCEYDSRRELFSICLQELNPFLKKITPRIELCKKYDTKNWTLSSLLKKSDSKICFFWNFNNGTLFQKYDSKNWTLFRTLRMELFYKYGLL